MEYRQRVEAAAKWLEQRSNGFKPLAGITLGTGLSGLAQAIDAQHRFKYGEIPGFPLSTVPGHSGELVMGLLEGKPVAALAGRFHLYEGYGPREVTFAVRVLALLGVEVMILSNAAGGLDPDMNPGRVMLIRDHINFQGVNPLVGENVDDWGERFTDMGQPYDPALLALARKTARTQGIPIYEGVYVSVLGPSLETPSETAMFRGFGADAVGMSTVLEAIAAKHHGLRTLAFSAISNVNIPENMAPIPLKMVLENAEKAGKDLGRLIAGVVAGL